MKSELQDLGTIDYKEAWDYQEKTLNDKLEKRKNNIPNTNTIILCEHPHVYTLGKSGKTNNLLINSKILEKINATYYEINRGGDITYHGPGQIVGYPIFDLQEMNMGVKEYIHKLEDAIILTLKAYNITASRLEGATGVWLDIDKPGHTRKICAIGVRVSRLVSMHGFALNVNTDLNYFSYINPCGFLDKGVTSMQKELGEELDLNLVKQTIVKNMESIFQFDSNA